jgi:hypothetical protein
MLILRVYKDADVTVGEMLEVLNGLGFEEIPSDPKEYLLENKAFNIKFHLPRKSSEIYVLKGYTAMFSQRLVDHGVLNDFDDLVKMVLKERARKKRALKKQQKEQAALAA